MKPFALIFVLFPLLLQAQNPGDAFRYTNTEVLGTARTLGVGGSLGPLGADFGSVSVNPAGLAMYRRSEFVGTVSTYSETFNTNLKDNDRYRQNTTKFNISSLGFVIHRNGQAENRQTNIAFGINRLANFNNETYYSGNSVGSILERFQEVSAGVPYGQLDPFEGKLAYDVGAIYTPNAQNLYKHDYQEAPEAVIRRSQRVTNSGGINELLVAVGTQVSKNFNIGFTLGSPVVRYSNTKVYSESDGQDLVPYFRGLTWTERLETKGQGINLKAGATYRFAHGFRIGAAIHSPTFIRMRDAFSTALEYDYIDGNSQGPFNGVSPDGKFGYNLRTPWKYSVSSALVVGSKGFITAEMEAQNFGNARFSFRDGAEEDLEYQQQLNNDIKATYRTALQFKVGGELAIKKLRLRAGGGFNTSALENDNTLGGYLTAGIGYRGERSYIDFGLRNRSQRGAFSPYNLTTVPARMQQVDFTGAQTAILLTFGTQLGY